MIRRSFLIAAMSLVAGVAQAMAGAQTKDKPNILIILSDDVGYSDLGCQGGEIRTPNLDALAARGVRFTNFYNSARCCPTRASLLTGLHPAQAGFPDMVGRLPRHAVTIPEVLRTAGYNTYMVGKWHLSEATKPTDRGFDEFYGMLGGFNSFWREDPFYTRWPEGRGKREYPPGTFYSTDAFGDYALDFLEQGREAGKPWFLYLAFNAAHFPLQAPEEDIARYEPVYADGWDRMRERRLERMKALGLVPKDLSLTPRTVVPKNWANAEKAWAADKPIPAWDSLPEDRRKDLTRRMATFAAMVDRMDRNIGRVVEHLKRTGQFEDTVIFYLSDNGACAEWDPFGFDVESGPKNILHAGADLRAIGSPGSYASYGSGWANACSTPYRYYKQYTHEGGILTPLIVHYPAGVTVEPGAMIRRPGYITDLMPTCVELAGATYPAERSGGAILPAEGASLMPSLRGAERPARPIFIEHEGSKAVRDGDWKLVRERGGHPWELYDLALDPTEMHDLAPREPGRVEAMAAAWDAWAGRCGLGPVAPRSVRGTIELRPDRVLAGADAPAIADVPFRIKAKVREASRGGVIVSQGAQVQGWSLFVRDRRPVFAVRREKALFELTADRILGDGPIELACELRGDGTARILLDGVEIARGDAGGLIPAQPNDPLIVGDDRMGAVGAYRTPQPFRGVVDGAQLIFGAAAPTGR
jgi:arylsulfatase A-like enzyme